VDREQQLHEVIQAYLKEVEAGQPIDRAEWLQRYPELAADLQAFLAAHDQAHAWAEPLGAPVPREPQLPRPASDGATQNLRSQAPSPPHLGTAVRCIGDYELLEEIARGGMGMVYRARQVSLNRHVALKMILAGELASAAEVRRFQTEAEAAASLDHPHIVPIYEVGEHDGRHYFSMKLIAPGTVGHASNT
jgi:serine/threonine-protein kinase